MDKDTPGTLEERARAIAASVTDDAFLAKAIIAGEVDYFRVVRSALAALTEAADEIASLRARVEAAEDELAEAVEHLEAVLFSDPGPKMLASIGAARAWWMKRDAREEAQALKDTP